MSIEDTEKYVTARITDILNATKLPDDKLPKCTDAERWYNKSKKVYNRCEKYCAVNKYCSQYQKEKELESIEVAEEI